MIEELHAQIDAVLHEVELAEQGGLTYVAGLRRARLADLLEIAARHGIALRPGRHGAAPTEILRTHPRKGGPVYTRVNTIFGPKDRVDAGVAQIEGPDRAAVEATRGNRGLTTMVDREAAVIVAISYWDELGRSSDAELTRARQNAVVAAGGTWWPRTTSSPSTSGVSVPAPGAAVPWCAYRSHPPAPRTG